VDTLCLAFNRDHNRASIGRFVVAFVAFRELASLCVWWFCAPIKITKSPVNTLIS
jgi:hypothetical protein